MAIYLLYNSEKFGPYEESIVADWLKSGRCSPNDLAWRDGMEKWQPLTSFYLTPYVGQAVGSSALMSQHPAQHQYSTQPPTEVKKVSLAGGCLLGIIGAVGCVLGGLLILSGIGIVAGLPLLFISLPIALLGVVLVWRSNK